MAAPTIGQILADAGFKTWWGKQNPGLTWNTQIERGKRDWLADYEGYLISQGIYPPWRGGETDTLPEPEGGYTEDQQAEYEAYLEYLKENPDSGLPTPKDIDDYFKNRDSWIEDYTPPEEIEGETEEKREYTDEEKREYNTWKNYAYTYGDPDDWYALDIDDYFKNKNLADEQLTEWQGREAEEKQYELSPEEQARRQQESYDYTQWARSQAEYGAQEAYAETPEYAQSFTEWFGTKGTKSQPLQSFIEGMFGKLKTQYEATQPREIGYPTREEARAEAARREAGFEAWLPTQTPELEKQFWAQSPYERGERPGTFAPRIRSVNW